MRDDESLPGWVDRPTFAERVGIHDGTVTTWIREGVIEPGHTVKNRHRIQMFSPADVTFARGLIALLRRRHGELKLQHAAAIVRSELQQPQAGHDPKKSPPSL